MSSYAEMGRSIGELTQMKNVAYGDSFDKCGELLKLLYPKGIHPEQYRDALAIVRVIDKLFRIATRKDAFGESPWKDIAGYGILGAVSDERAVEADEACDERRDHFKATAGLVAEPWQPKPREFVRIVGGVGPKEVGTIGFVKEVLTGYPYDSFRFRVLFGRGHVGLFALEELERMEQP